MSESVDTELLVNCTILAVYRFSLKTPVNESTITSLNRTEIVSLLSGIITQKDNDENINAAKDFMTECLFPSPTRPYELPWEQKTIWGFVFGMMLFIAITGNCIVLWIVLGHKRMRTVTNYFLLNLSIADLLMSSLNCVFNFIFMLNSDWPFGTIYCTINNFIANVTVSTSVFTLVAISFDRYVAIVYPLKRRTSRGKVRVFLLLIWIFSGVLAAPCLLYSSTVTKTYYNGKTRTVCFMMWPDGRYPTSMADYVYNIIFLILTYGIPMLVMLVCYFLMGRVLWGSQSIGEHTERQLEIMKSKKKVVRMFIVVVAIFAICWLPYHLFFIYAYHNNKLSSAKYVQHMYLGFYWLAMSNAMVNPIIYYWMNRRFRIYFQEIICFCCLNLTKNTIRTDSPSILMHQNTLTIRHKREYTESNFRRSNSAKWKRSTTETQVRNNNFVGTDTVDSNPVRKSDQVKFDKPMGSPFVNGASKQSILGDNKYTPSTKAF